MNPRKKPGLALGFYLLRPSPEIASELSGERSGAQKLASGIKIRHWCCNQSCPRDLYCRWRLLLLAAGSSLSTTGGGWFILIHDRRMKWIQTLISRLRASLHQEAQEPRVPQGTSDPQACPPTSRLSRGRFRTKWEALLIRRALALPTLLLQQAPI